MRHIKLSKKRSATSRFILYTGSKKQELKALTKLLTPVFTFQKPYMLIDLTQTPLTSELS